MKTGNERAEGERTPPDTGDTATTLVDVAIPVFRRATFLNDSVESVLRQTFERWSLTICDNGPGGGEIERAASAYLADPRVSYVATGSELPVAENWTSAMRHGSAPYIGLLPDDDRWHPEFLDARVEALERHPECAFAFAEYVETDVDGREVARAPVRYREGVLTRELMAREFVRQCIVTPPAIVVRRSAFEAVGGTFHGWHYCDWEMWARLAARFPAYYLARQDCDFRRHPRTNALLNPDEPERLLRMVRSIEDVYERELPGFELSRVERARNRSRALLHSAVDVHTSGGWRVSGPAYRRALREYPPAFFTYLSLWMVARTLLGRRLSNAVAWGLRWFRPQVRAQRQAMNRR